MATLPELAAGLAPLRRALTGSVLRPWCHFELPASAYLTQGSLQVFVYKCLPHAYCAAASVLLSQHQGRAAHCIQVTHFHRML